MNNIIKYQGLVTIDVFKKGKKIKSYKMHNAGKPALFTFLVSCLTATNNEAFAYQGSPGRLQAFSVADEGGAVTPLTGSLGATQKLQVFDADTGGYLVSSFNISAANVLKDQDQVAEGALKFSLQDYSGNELAEMTGLKDATNAAIELNLEEDEVWVINWKLSFANKEIANASD